ncbi:MAG TPA: DinB family protein [Gemmatimonadaceae bacterium]
MRPTSEEYAPYYGKYVSLVPDDDMDIVHLLADQHHETVDALRKAKQKGDFAYAEGKWTVKDVIEHVCDTERIFAYRALRIARGDTTPLPGFEQDDYVKTAEASRRSMDDLLEELWSVRAATLSLAKHLPKASLTRRGTASGNPVSVRALLYIIAGHERHHLAILKERYGV